MEKIATELLKSDCDDNRNPFCKPPSPLMADDGDKDTGLNVAQRSQNGATDETEVMNSSLMVRLDRFASFRIHTNSIDFTLSRPHGCGGKAEVVKATLKRRDGSIEDVAVKKLRYCDDTNNRKFSNEFVHEVDVTARLSHENIVQLIGFVEDLQKGTAWIILSWEPNGNVSEFLAAGKWEIPERLSLIKDTFAGLEYLHTRQPPICHGDLKSLNIIVSASCRAIITDFGSARILRENENHQEDRHEVPHMAGASATAPSTDERISSPQITIFASSNQLTLTGPAWSLRWAAPEVALGEPQNLASDIWAAGWICWEVMTNKVPFPDLNSEGAITLKVVQGEVPAAREDTQLSQIVRLWSLMTDCWAFDPRNRPNIARCNSEVKWMPSIPPLAGTPSAELLHQMGLVHRSQGSCTRAIQLFQQALSAASSEGDQKIGARALCGLGGTYYIISKYAEAERYLTHAQDICSRLNDDMGQANAFVWLAKVYRAQGGLTWAEESYTQAQTIYSRIGNDGGRANTLHGLGSIFRERSQYSEAEKFYNQAKSIYADIGDDRGQANTLRRLGTLYCHRHEYTKAEESFKETLDIYSRIGDNLGRANVTRNLGHLYRLQGLNADAAPSFAEARSSMLRSVTLIQRKIAPIG